MPRDERAFLASALLEEDKRPKTPPKGTPERQCGAYARRTGKPCRAPKCRRPDGTLAPRCRMHGGELGPLTSQIRALQGLLRMREAACETIRTKLAVLEEQAARVRDMGGSLDVVSAKPDAPGT